MAQKPYTGAAAVLPPPPHPKIFNPQKGFKMTFHVILSHFCGLKIFYERVANTAVAPCTFE